MPNKIHVLLVKKGSEDIDKWRTRHPEERLDLRGAELAKVDLTKANLSRAFLNGADLTKGDMRWIDLKIYPKLLNRLQKLIWG